MGDKKKYTGGQVGSNRSNASPDGWFPPRNLSKSEPGGARSGPRSSGADPGKPGRLGRIIAKITGRKK